LKRDFYERSSIEVAPDLVGKILVRRLENGRELKGIIVETEAYGGFDDAASHAFKGKTKRNDVMFGEAGHAYIYFTYGFHHCLNFVTNTKGIPGAVLIRAVKPILGINFMQSRRGTKNLANVASGPGKICQAFNIDRSLNGIDVTLSKSPISVSDDKEHFLIKESSRIGIRNATEKQWRFYADDCDFVSK
jgi:DNA-3-methyladenine glycosylase